MTLVSIVIPCFNDGVYLPRALASVQSLKDQGVAEVIVVDDGSDDQKTQELFGKLKGSGCTILHQANKGLSAARNAGITNARSKYILPLDSDNQMIASFVSKAIDILEKNARVDVVYSDFIRIGASDVDVYYKAGAFDLCRLINDNFIDACAVFRRSVWEALDGYDENIRVGTEDWDFWLRAGLANMSFHYLPDAGFYYLVREGSLLHNQTPEQGDALRNYVYNKHNAALCESIRRNYIHPDDNFKAKYIDLQARLKSDKLKSIAKILLGKDFY